MNTLATAAAASASSSFGQFSFIFILQKTFSGKQDCHIVVVRLCLCVGVSLLDAINSNASSSSSISICYNLRAIDQCNHHHHQQQHNNKEIVWKFIERLILFACSLGFKAKEIISEKNKKINFTNKLQPSNNVH